MKTINYILIFCLAVLFISCGGSESKTNENSDSKTEKQDETGTKEESTTESSSNNPYKVKSGHLLYNTSMGMTIETWFDDYGNTQYTESLIEMFGEKSGSKTYIIDGFKYDYSIGTTEGTKMKYYAAQSYDYKNVSEADLSKYGVEFHGNETILGKDCEVISIKEPVESKVWVWEGIPMKTVSKLGKQDFVMEIVEIDTDNVELEKFVLPEEINFIEY
ncbi:MAG TPA: hypothetical protein P5538_03555 [Bacteroidales bacterium]|nr:hypothetical protein [Bacteroidales bacterium]HOL98207.1 hypothetical protein [Bacteroidales bacterium]HOM36430.1 hypothetical protein [Bacteroidales bacterium]HPD23896.1 hypothetical protein [Bacteroidales bacterium]HRS99967.1 hypothetical protein [Bacteroidales bacterium]